MPQTLNVSVVRDRRRPARVFSGKKPGAQLRSKSRKSLVRGRIQDEFSALPISRQRKYQLRMRRDRRCAECGDSAIAGSRCLKHLIMARERQRKTRGLKRRYFCTLSYKLQAA